MARRSFLLLVAAASIVAVSTALTACSRSNSRQTGSHAPVAATVFTPSFASGFRIDSLTDGSKVIVTTNPWQGASPSDERRYAVTTLPRRIAVMSATHIAMMRELKESDKIVAASSVGYIYDSAIRNRLGNRADFGYEGNVDFEKLLALKPDLVIIYSTGGPSPMEKNLERLNIPYLYFGDYAEETPLGKAEWIVAMAELSGRRSSGMAIFDRIATRYLQLKETLSQNGDSLSQESPKVMVNGPYGDAWFCPPADSYAVRLIEDAGGKYMLSEIEGNASKPIDIERGVALGEEADVWLSPGNFTSISELCRKIPKMARSAIVSRKMVFTNTKRTTKAGGNDYFETGTVRPDLILQDLSQIFTAAKRHEPIVSDSLFFYRRLL